MGRSRVRPVSFHHQRWVDMMARMETVGVLDGLTGPQREAVMHGEGPLLVLAGPGSGKTRVITHRAAYLAQTLTRPEHILTITFTNKAAREMAERMARLGLQGTVTCTTFHSFCARLLRIYHRQAGVGANFSIFDEADQRAAIKMALGRLGLRGENFPPREMLDLISRAKNDMRCPQACMSSAQSFQDQKVAEAYVAYEQVLAEQNALDFDDLLLRVANMLRDCTEVRNTLADRYRFVLVDEYQDTNRPQYFIAAGLCLEHHNLCATGDPDQSIYAWRGADIKNILTFEDDFPDAKVVRLEQNYRSTMRILAAADALIGHNVRRKAKQLWTQNEAGGAVQIAGCENPRAEALWITQQIREHLAAGGEPRDVAVFYRLNSLSRQIETALFEARIPYQVARGVAFYERKEIKDLLAYLKLASNPRDQVAFRRAVQAPSRGIGRVTLDRVSALAVESGADMLALLRGPRCAAEVGKAAGRLQAFADLIEAVARQAEHSVSDAVRYAVRHSGLIAAWGKQDDREILEYADEFINAAGEYDQEHADGSGSLADWLAQICLISDVDSVDAQAGAVTLMTLHAAKGLEFNRVFVLGVEEDLLPHRHREGRDADVEEERRLLFVGMTRARQMLALTYSEWRDHHGGHVRRSASRFLRELPNEEIEWLRVDKAGLPRVDEQERFRAAPPIADERLHPGGFVQHAEYGLGRVMSIERSGQGTLARIHFVKYGDKAVILEYCELTPIDPDEIGDVE